MTEMCRYSSVPALGLADHCPPGDLAYDVLDASFGGVLVGNPLVVRGTDRLPSSVAGRHSATPDASTG